MSSKSTDFKFLITLSSVTGAMAQGELERKGIPVKTTSSGTNVSWNTLMVGASSPAIFMPAMPIDIYVPENKTKESKEIIESFGWEKEDVDFPKTRWWQKIWALLWLLVFIYNILK